jgi:hypothetical protein
MTVVSKYVYLALQDKTIQKIYKDSQLTLRGLAHLYIIPAMAVTRKNDFKIIGGYKRGVKKMSIKNGEIVREFGQISNTSPRFFLQAPGDGGVFVFDIDCHFQLIDIGEGTIIQDFGEVHREEGKFYQRNVVGGDGEYLWTSSHEGEMKQ